MRLLLDENLSEAVVVRIAEAFPGSEHVRRAIGGGVSDDAVWNFAARERMTLVTLDEDFQVLSIGRGAPPKVIWIDAHNPRSAAIADLLIRRMDVIRNFIADPDAAMLVLCLQNPR